MAIEATYDFGTVRLYESSGVIEASFPFGDTVTRDVVKSFRARFDKPRKAWRIDPHYAKRDTGEIVHAIRSALVDAAPQSWKDSLPALGGLVTTTRNFEMKAGEGGIRMVLPAGHVHEWTLKNAIKGPEKEGNSWLIRAVYCEDGPVRNVIRDVIRDDMKALASAVDYLGGFSLSGSLDLTEGEAMAIGLVKGATVFANPSFLRKADPIIGPEPVTEYALGVMSTSEGEEGKLSVSLGVLHGQDAWKALRGRYSKGLDSRSMPLDSRHLWGKWVRRRI